MYDKILEQLEQKEHWNKKSTAIINSPCGKKHTKKDFARSKLESCKKKRPNHSRVRIKSKHTKKDFTQKRQQNIAI